MSKYKFIFLSFVFLSLSLTLVLTGSFYKARVLAEEAAFNNPDTQPTNSGGSFFTQEARLLASDGVAQNQFGSSVAISGNWAVVGMPSPTTSNNLQGSAYVYERSGGVWTQRQKLIGSDSAMNDKFGYSVAVWGDTIAVGRYNTVTGVNRSDGKVYIFRRSGNTWTETQTVVSDDLAQGDSFGYSVALEENTLIVGARNKQIGANFFQGAAYVFTRASAGANFTQQARLLGSDTGANDFFGEAVSISGDTAVIGSVTDFGQQNVRGKAYVFVRSGSSWAEQQILQATGSAPNDGFGLSVSVSGNYALIGARTEPIGSSGEIGAAYVFVRSGGAWTQQQKFTGLELTPRNDFFGYAVTIKGDTLAIGSPAHEIVGNITNHGAVYVYRRSGASWARTQKIIHDDPNPDALGQAVAFDGNSIIAGAPSKNSARGAAYVFKANATNGQFKLIPPEVFIGTQFGQSLGLSDDTAAIGSNLGTYIYKRNGSNWDFAQKLSLISENNTTTSIMPNSSIVFSDGMMIVGASGARINNVNLRGAVVIYTRNAQGVWTEQQRLLASDGAAGDQFGSSLAVSGNTLVVGALGDTIGANTNQGSAYVFTLNGGSWTEQQKLTAADGTANDRFGSDVAVSGDTAVVGAFGKMIGTNGSQGAAYVFTRAGSAWTQQQRLLALDGGANHQYGTSVAVESDTVAVGANLADAGSSTSQGAVYVYTRAGTTWTQQQKLFDPSGQAGDQFGIDIVLGGDQLFIGANGVNSPPNWEAMGAIYVFGRNGQSWQQRRKIFPFDTNHNKQLGFRIAVSGNNLAGTAFAETNYGVFNSGAGYVVDLTQLQNNSTDYDFDGDGKADLAVFRPSNGAWYVTRSSNNSFTAETFGQSGDIISPNDFDGDGRTDLAVFRGGFWYIKNSSDGQFRGAQFGTSGDIPTAGDYDGDGKADISVFRPSNGVWYRINSSDNSFSGIAFGQAGDKPTIGNFDGDGKTDIAVFRPSNGVWYRINSSNGGFNAVQFGTAEDLVVPADYDGDGKADIAVFRPSNGVWYRINSSDNSFAGTLFGISTDKPVPADYDGDGKTDIAVYRGGFWHILQSSNGGSTASLFGTGDDSAIPNAPVR